MFKVTVKPDIKAIGKDGESEGTTEDPEAQGILRRGVPVSSCMFAYDVLGQLYNFLPGSISDTITHVNVEWRRSGGVVYPQYQFFFQPGIPKRELTYLAEEPGSLVKSKLAAILALTIGWHLQSELLGLRKMCDSLAPDVAMVIDKARGVSGQTI